MNEIKKADVSLKKILPPVRPQTGKRYIPSQFLLTLTHNGREYVFNTITKQCLETTLPESAAAGDGHDELIEALFLVPDDKDECAFYESISAIMRTLGRKKDIRGYTIMPTLACNARCIYCYEEGMSRVSMTRETVESTIDYIMKTRRKDKAVSISWFGGEPLMRRDVIDRICGALREKGVEYKSSMVSNGSLITAEIADSMAGDWNLDSIQISMDGTERDYIARKNYYSYNNTYRDVMHAVSLMSEKGINVTIRCNVDENNIGDFPAVLEDLKANVTHRDNVSVYSAPLNSVRMGSDDIALWKRIMEMRPLIADAGFKAAPFIGLGMGFRTNHCMADKGMVVIAPDGSLYPCEHCPQESRFGNVVEGITDKAAHDSFCNIVGTREKCRRCPFLPDCTSFANCPVQDTHCRELRHIIALDVLRELVDNSTVSETDDGGHIC